MMINFEKFCSHWEGLKDELITLHDSPIVRIVIFQTSAGEKERYFRVILKEERKFKYLKPYNLENLYVFLENRNKLTLSVSNSDIFETFNHLVFTIYETIAESTDTNELENKIINSFQRFFSLFSKKKRNSISKIVGVYGELLFLKMLIAHFDSSLIRNWNGPDKNRHDFSLSNSSIEIKSRYREYGSLQISNENQLFFDPPERLFLKVFDFDIKENGDVDSVKELIQELFEMSENMEYKLMLISKINEVGLCFEEDFALPNPIRIDQLFEESFQVLSEFPRITKNDLPEGINDVKYKIQMSSIPEKCKIVNKDLWKHLK